MEAKHASRETLVRRPSAGRDGTCERHGSLTFANGVESDTSDFFSCNICYDVRPESSGGGLHILFGGLLVLTTHAGPMCVGQAERRCWCGV